MSYKTILVVLQSKADAERVLKSALPLASHFSAHLIGVHAEAIPIPYVTPMGFPDTDFITTSTEINEQRSAEIQELFESHASREGISFEWQAMRNVSGDSAISALGIARSCDLILAQQSDPDGESGSQANLETLLFESGRPVLFVPYASPAKSAFRKVLVAWNGTQQAARAVFDALPFILQADQTEILSIDAPDNDLHDSEVAGVDIAATLSRHGAKVVVTSQASGGIGAAPAIENRVADGDIDLLVMGAYSQSWLKQFFFGGTTRTVLQSMPVATLMSR
jgi:nucleotide-binding universal stress UspA family protein